ncbi:SDR family NAD(P)-dependent oxidoreductase [Methylocystis parvus]|uniref:SDR family NAD(P)-dependent oxidoreductase n=1 Tax=Methylocystis parvus TaxID=134 RepID=A0A6B8M895_9HYPH|nr:SDR family NAD(P)-dependent oxidoreductase [Methylocystis parvus]QGM96960.1 SDR family NAD(P)-dependent oxidoreductase [Methylocystis parvus]WBJ99153.1 SDR family NAD(P)-dependent oxidoreductase [Methylocystis parvus OBBP]
MRVFITGTAGFIGFHLARRLLAAGHLVDGYDGMTRYYDPRLKEARRAILLAHDGYRDTIAMLEDMEALTKAAKQAAPDVIVHLAAQAGVRYSLENPRAYVEANLVGTFNVLEVARMLEPRHLLIASTSSVYGANPTVPFLESDRADEPLTLYAASKKAGEAMAHSYAHLWSIPTTMFRFFTVYGPWGRPDMAPLKFLDAIESGRAIDIYNHGNMLRDFTYIDDLVEGVARLMDCVPARDSGDASVSAQAPYRIVNIGRGAPVPLLDFIDTLESALGKQATRNYLDMQKGDVPRTFASADLLERLTGYRPQTSVEEGVKALVEWYREYRATNGPLRL